MIILFFTLQHLIMIISDISPLQAVVAYSQFIASVNVTTHGVTRGTR